MIQLFRNSPCFQLCWVAMAMLLLNLSVDSPDPLPRHLPEDLTHNDQESIVEWVVEKLFGFDGAFAEYDDDDTDERSSKLTFNPDATLLVALPFELQPPIVSRKASVYPPYAQWCTSAHRDIDAPPPRF